MMRRSAMVMLAFAWLGCMGMGCSSSDEPTAGAITLTKVAWNPSNVPVGEVHAVAEHEDTVAVFSNTGVTTFTSGAEVGNDTKVSSWRSAGVIPSAAGLGMWLVGVDGEGRMQRVRGQDAVEDVSDRFGLAGDKVRAVAADGKVTAFLLDQGFATSDGVTVTRYAAADVRAVSAGKGVIAVAEAYGVRLFDGVGETGVALPDATFVTYDSAGVLFAATHHALYKYEGSAMRAIYDAGERSIRALTSSGSNVWFAVDADLAVVTNEQVAISSTATFAGGERDVRLAGSPSGDVWAMFGGQLLRYSAQPNGGDESTWTTSVQPVYAEICSQCHSAPGSGKDASNVDLSTYSAWNARRESIYERVVTRAGTPRAMPPAGSGFTLNDAQRAAIEAWARSK